MPPPDSVIKLCKTFAEHRDHYRSGSFNEFQIRKQFLDPGLTHLKIQQTQKAVVIPGSCKLFSFDAKRTLPNFAFAELCHPIFICLSPFHLPLFLICMTPQSAVQQSFHLPRWILLPSPKANWAKARGSNYKLAGMDLWAWICVDLWIGHQS